MYSGSYVLAMSYEKIQLRSYAQGSSFAYVASNYIMIPL